MNSDMQQTRKGWRLRWKDSEGLPRTTVFLGISEDTARSYLAHIIRLRDTRWQDYHKKPGCGTPGCNCAEPRVTPSALVLDEKINHILSAVGTDGRPLFSTHENGPCASGCWLCRARIADDRRYLDRIALTQ